MATKWISPTWRMPDEQNQSKFENYSMSFDGSSEYVDLNFQSLSTPTTISIWVNTAVNDSQQRYAIINGRADQTPVLYLRMQSDNTYQVFLSNSNGSDTLQASAATINTWFNFVIVCNNTETLLYENGTLKDSSTIGWSGIDINQSNNWQIGRDSRGQRYFKGNIDQVAIFDYSLSQSQINYLYNSGTPVNPMAISGNAPIAYYPLGGSSTGSASTLTVPNDSVPSATVFDFVPNDFIDAPVSALNSTANFTVSFWGQRDTTSTTFGVGSKNSSTNRMFLSWFSDNVVYFNCKSGSDQSAATYSGLTSTDTNWHHYVGVFEGGVSQKLYVDGVLRSTITSGIPATTYATMGDDFNIGLVDNTSYSDGKISNAQIWDTNLSSSEITTLYNYGSPLSGTQPQAANLRAWYPMDVSNANWEADTASTWQIADAVSSYPQSFNFSQNKTITTSNVFSDIVTGSNKMGVCTISYWYKSSGTGIRDYMSLNDATTLAAHFRVDSSNKFYYRESNNYLRFAAQTNLDEWHHHCWVFNSATSYQGTAGQTNGDLQFYVNGVVQAVDFDFSATPANDPWDRFNIARSEQTSGSGLDFEMSNLQLHNTNFSASQVLQLYNNGVPLTSAIATSNLKAWYKLDNTATFSTNWSIPDASGNGNTGISSGMTEQNLVNNNVSTLNGTSSGMTTANLVNSDLTRSIPYSSYSIHFDTASADYIDLGIPSALDFETGEMTLSCWINLETLSGIKPILGNSNSGITSYQYLLDANRTAAKISFLTSGVPTLTSSLTLSANTWYHICLTRSGTTSNWVYTMYINGSSSDGATASTTTNPPATQTTAIGRYGAAGGYYFQGEISNFSAFNTALNQNQILTIYNGGVPNDISSLSPAGWWSLSGDSYYNGTDFICPDLSSNSNNGTSSGMGGSELVGNGPGSTANGTATSMNIPENLQGNAPNSTKNAFSINMTETDRVSGTGNVPS